MKRLFTLFTGLCVMLLAGCNDEYDDSALVKRLDDFEQRLERLERLCNDMNTNLGSMQTIVTALDRGDYITSVEPLTENGSMVGYTIRFAKGTPIVVYNGKPGTAPVVSVKKDTDGIYYWTLDGEWLEDSRGDRVVAQGPAGRSAYELAVENGYRGTLEEWLASLNGNNGRSAYELAVENGYRGTEEEWLASLKGTAGDKGDDGNTPKLKIENGYWYVSYGDDDNWVQLG